MIYGLYLSAGGLQTSEYRQSVVANNIANAGTTGFKQQLAVLSERRVEADEDGPASARHNVLDNLTGGTFVRPTFTDFARGMLEMSSNPLDLAIAGDGFFHVEAAGEDRYTRDGRLTIDETGTLVTASGHKILDADGEPILVNPRSAAPVSVSPDGVVQQGAKTLGRIEVVDFDDRQGLTPAGKNLFRAHGQAPRLSASTIRAGATESSNVDPLTGMVEMIQVTRAYQMNATMVSLQEQMLGRTVNDLGRIG